MLAHGFGVYRGACCVQYVVGSVFTGGIEPGGGHQDGAGGTGEWGSGRYPQEVDRGKPGGVGGRDQALSIDPGQYFVSTNLSSS